MKWSSFSTEEKDCKMFEIFKLGLAFISLEYTAFLGVWGHPSTSKMKKYLPPIFDSYPYFFIFPTNCLLKIKHLFGYGVYILLHALILL